MNSFHAKGAIDYGQYNTEFYSTSISDTPRHKCCWRNEPEEGRRDTSREASLRDGSRSCEGNWRERISHLRTV